MNESLKKEENKKIFRELVKKYHPDTGNNEEITNNEEMTKKLLDAQVRVNDEAFERFLKEISVKKPDAKESNQKNETSDSYKKTLWGKVKEQDGWFEELNLKNVSAIPRVILDPNGYYILFDLRLDMGVFTARITIERTENMSKEEFKTEVKRVIVKAIG